MCFGSLRNFRWTSAYFTPRLSYRFRGVGQASRRFFKVVASITVPRKTDTAILPFVSQMSCSRKTRAWAPTSSVAELHGMMLESSCSRQRRRTPFSHLNHVVCGFAMARTSSSRKRAKLYAVLGSSTLKFCKCMLSRVYLIIGIFEKSYFQHPRFE